MGIITVPDGIWSVSVLSKADLILGLERIIGQATVRERAAWTYEEVQRIQSCIDLIRGAKEIESAKLPHHGRGNA